MSIFVQKTELMDTLHPFLTNKKGIAESTRQLRFCRELIHNCHVIICEATLKCIIAHP